MIDILAAAIQYFKSAGLSVTQIAEKDRYGDTWEAGSRSILVRLDGGTPELDLPVQDVRLEVRCFAESSVYAMQILGEINTLSRATDRESVIVGTDTALIYWLHPASGGTPQYDPDLNMDFALMFFDARISEIAVET